jgi:hypothetical protein
MSYDSHDQRERGMKLCPRCQKQFSDDANFCPVDAARLVPLETQSVAADSLAAKFDLGDQLGGGRTGAVYRATDKATGQPAAVKIIAPAVVVLPGLAQRLERELKQLERVQSGGVARVLASGKRGDDSWVALELLDGARTLAEAVAARGPMPVPTAAHLVTVIGEALIEAAQVGVVHRDLAPKNILFVDNDVKLINFSLPVPTSDKVPGVPEFVAPEQHDGKPVDQRSNLYSLGALYYFVLTGQPVQSDASGAVQPPSSLADVPGPVEAVILRALDRSPTKRFLTVRQFIDEVGRIARGESDLRSTQPLGRAGKPKADLVATQPDGAGAVGTMLGVGISPVGPSGNAAPQGSERSPWAPRGATAATAAAAADAAAAGPAIASPTAPAAATTPMAVAAPVVPAIVASPILPGVLPGAGATAGGKARAADPDDAKGKFRETLWFKKGELDAQAAETAAEEHARTGKLTSDKADQLPIDERYQDDGSLSRSDKHKYSLRTGSTTSNTALRESSIRRGAVSEDALIGEMKRGRGRILALIAIGLAVLALILFVVFR